VSYPLPGTKFYDSVKSQMGIKTHWQESNDLEMMFQGTYTSNFYRAVRDLLHDQVAMQLGVPSERNDHIRAKTMMNQRWQTLLQDELQHRSSALHPAATA